MLSDDQARRAVEVLREYLAAPPGPDGRPPPAIQAERDRKRVAVIETELVPLLSGYLIGTIELAEFKRKVDGINKQHPYWGFKGIKGQMFFNMVVNVADDEKECDSELKSALVVPRSEESASSRIKTFASYVKRIGQHHGEIGGDARGSPKIGSVPFFLSYFWQVQDRNTWPVYYTNSVNTMVDLNLWQPTEDPANDYLTYKDIHEELARLFSSEAGRPFALYDVEHVFWFKGGNPYGGNRPLAAVRPPPREAGPQAQPSEPSLERLPDSFVPPIVAILPRMAVNEPALREIAKASGTSLERAFEKSINAAFTILGCETRPLGQGQGRVPDGQALAQDEAYAILWDAKVRTEAYSMGTDDRAIRDYVGRLGRELKRRRGMRNIYYFIISGRFADEFDDLVRSLKMETDINEVCLVEAAALVAMVDQKVRSPQTVSLGPDGLQRLFSSSGVLTAGAIEEFLA